MDSQSLETLADLLLEWEEGYRRGEELSAADLASEHPELAAALDARIRILKLARWLDAPSEATDGPNDGDPGAVDDAPGRVLAGRYHLDRRIATGGFAEVWLAHDEQLNRTVAIKFPTATRVKSAEAVLAEARCVARLNHPHILPVHDVGVENGTCFIVTDYLDGGSLADRMESGPIGSVLAIRWIAQVAEALDVAHRQGITHRDVKPANILLNGYGDAVLGDFGIARASAADDADAPLGTLRYMAPEQLAGQSCTPQSDIYSLGVVLHEASSDLLPYESSEPEALRRAIANGEGIRIAAILPKPLAAVCRKALCRTPAERHGSAAEFAAALRKAGSAPVRSWPRWIAVLSMVLLGVAFLLWRAVRQGTHPAYPSVTVGPLEPGIDLVIEPSGLVPMLRPTGDPPEVRLECWTVGEMLPYVVEAVNVRQYREWQDPPVNYFGPRRDGEEGRLVCRFDFPAPVRTVAVRFEAFCVDFLEEAGGEGRGASGIEISTDGKRWHTLYDHLDPPEWGRRWGLIDEALPEAIRGARTIWLRARFLSSGCPNDDYTVAQVGRPRPDGQSPAFRLVAELEPGAE